jgi:hypothetical protein
VLIDWTVADRMQGEESKSDAKAVDMPIVEWAFRKGRHPCCLPRRFVSAD